jgi:TBC1 domain family protein 5
MDESMHGTNVSNSRWMRLLFGREFPFDDVLMMWDLLFAHGLRSDLIDFTCIAMLLRIRWQCWLASSAQRILFSLTLIT